MKDSDKELKMIKIIFRSISILVLIVGIFFSYMIAEFDDAPGMMIIGPTFTLVASSFVYGFGEMIINTKKNNALLSEINKELTNKKKEK